MDSGLLAALGPGMTKSDVAVEERRDGGILSQARDVLRGRQLRLVALRIDHAEEAERLIGGRTELVPGHRRHGDEIARLEPLHLVADEAMAAPAQNDDAV